MVRIAIFALFTLGAVIYGVWTNYGAIAGSLTAVSLLVMLGAIFGVGRRQRKGSVLDEMRQKAAKRWTCRSCGTKAAPKSTMCLTCGASF